MFFFVIKSNAQPPDDNQLNSWIEQEMNNQHLSGMSITLIQNYQIKWTKSFGIANKSNQKPVMINTLFQAGSISKPVTAMTALKAVQDGKLALNKDINSYLTSWILPENQWTKYKKVTLKKLLDHSAGISIHGFVGYGKSEPLPTLIQILNGKAPANSKPVRVTETPGVNFRYSGGGYMIIQQTLMDVYHQSFVYLTEHLIFQPLKMTETTFEQPMANEKLKNIAMPYDTIGNPVTGGPHTYVEQAAAGLWTTSEDLAKFLISIQKSLKGDNHQILNKHYACLMVEPSINKNMGLGFEIGVNKFGKKDPKGNYFMHMGENAGYRNIIIGNKNHGDGLIIMTNMSPESELILQGKIKEDWSAIYNTLEKIAMMENWQ